MYLWWYLGGWGLVGFLIVGYCCGGYLKFIGFNMFVVLWNVFWFLGWGNFLVISFLNVSGGEVFKLNIEFWEMFLK